MPYVQRNGLLRSWRRAPSGGSDSLEQGDSLQHAGPRVAGNDGPLLPGERMAVPAPRRIRSSLRVQSAARDSDVGAGARTVAGSRVAPIRSRTRRGIVSRHQVERSLAEKFRDVGILNAVLPDANCQ